MKKTTEAKSVTTRRTAKASDLSPFSKIIFPDGKVKVVGSGPNDISLENNTATVYEIWGGGRETIDLSSGEFYVQESLEDLKVSDLEKLSKDDEEVRDDEEKRKSSKDKDADFVSNLFRGKNRGKDNGNGDSPDDMLDDDDIVLGDDPVEQGQNAREGEEKKAGNSNGSSKGGKSEVSDSEDGEFDDLKAFKDGEFDNLEVLKDIMAAIDDLIDYEKERDKEHGECDDKKVKENLRVKRDLARFLGEESGAPKDEVEAGGVTDVKSGPTSKVGLPSTPKDGGEDGGGEPESQENTSVTDPTASNPSSGKPKSDIEGHPEESTPQEEPDTEDLIGSVDDSENAGVSESLIIKDIREAISLVARGVDPDRLAKRVLAGL